MNQFVARMNFALEEFAARFFAAEEDFMARQEEEFDADMETCIEHCTECHRICLETMQYCLSLGGEHAAAAHIGLLIDCAQICQTSADFMIRGSRLHQETCAACAEICAHCADACAALGAEDEQMQECAEICSQCAE